MLVVELHPGWYQDNGTTKRGSENTKERIHFRIFERVGGEAWSATDAPLQTRAVATRAVRCVHLQVCFLLDVSVEEREAVFNKSQEYFFSGGDVPAGGYLALVPFARLFDFSLA